MDVRNALGCIALVVVAVTATVLVQQYFPDFMAYSVPTGASAKKKQYLANKSHESQQQQKDGSISKSSILEDDVTPKKINSTLPQPEEHPACFSLQTDPAPPLCVEALQQLNDANTNNTKAFVVEKADETVEPKRLSIDYDALVAQIQQQIVEMNYNKLEAIEQIHSSKDDSNCIPQILPNGMMMLVRKVSAMDVFSAILIVQTGEIYEEEDQKGVAQFVSYLATSSRRHCLSQKLQRKLDNLISRGIEVKLHSSTDRIKTVFHVCLENIGQEASSEMQLALTNGAEVAVSSICEWIFSLLVLPAEDLQAEYVRYQMKKNKKMEDSTFTPEVLHVGRIINFFKKWYRPNRMGFALLGKFSHSDHMAETMTKQCMTLPKRPLVQSILSKERPSNLIEGVEALRECESTLSISSNDNSTLSFLLILHPKQDERQQDACETMASIFTEMEMRVFIAAVDKKVQSSSKLRGGRLCRSEIKMVCEEWAFSLTASLIKKSALSTVVDLWREFTRLIQQGFSLSDLMDAKESVLHEMKSRELQICFTEQNSLITNDFVSYFMGEYDAYFDGYATLRRDFIDTLDKVTIQTINEIGYRLVTFLAAKWRIQNYPLEALRKMIKEKTSLPPLSPKQHLATQPLSPKSLAQVC